MNNNINIYELALKISSLDEVDAKKQIYDYIAKENSRIDEAIKFAVDNMFNDVMSLKMIHDELEKTKKDNENKDTIKQTKDKEKKENLH